MGPDQPTGRGHGTALSPYPNLQLEYILITTSEPPDPEQDALTEVQYVPLFRCSRVTIIYFPRYIVCRRFAWNMRLANVEGPC